MKLYRRKVRAVAEEIGDLHFRLDNKYYPWYYEEDFPIDMKMRVKEDNPFGGWYKYKVEEEYELERES